MAFPWAETLSAGTQLIGLFSGKGSKKNATAKSVENLLREMINRVQGYDPASAAELSAERARLDAEKAMERATANIFSKFAGMGSHGWLPDTARQGSIRGALYDVGDTLARFLADKRSNVFSDWMRMAAIPVGLAAAGRGEPLPSSGFDYAAGAKSFADLIKAFMNKGNSSSGSSDGLLGAGGSSGMPWWSWLGLMQQLNNTGPAKYPWETEGVMA